MPDSLLSRIRDAFWWPGRRRRGRTGLRALVADLAAIVVLTFGIIQLVPHGRVHTNPPVTGEPAWSSPRTRALMADACFGCHSKAEWPW